MQMPPTIESPVAVVVKMLLRHNDRGNKIPVVIRKLETHLPISAA